MKDRYDIFISYRREGGYDTAKHLNDLLVRDGYRVSFDIDTLRNGDFDEQLYDRIDQCEDFILIVDAHAFDRSLDPKSDPTKDWLRCELAHALQKGKNIIPVFLAGVKGFPENLPEDIQAVEQKNGPEYNRYYFNDFYRALKTRFLSANPYKRIMRYAISALVVILLVVGSILISKKYFVPNDPRGGDRDTITPETIQTPQTTDTQEISEPQEDIQTQPETQQTQTKEVITQPESPKSQGDDVYGVPPAPAYEHCSVCRPEMTSEDFGPLCNLESYEMIGFLISYAENESGEEYTLTIQDAKTRVRSTVLLYWGGFSKSELYWLSHVLIEGNKLKIKYYTCGSDGVMWAYCLETLPRN